MDLSNYEEAARNFKLLQECYIMVMLVNPLLFLVAFAENQAGKNVDALRSIGEAIKHSGNAEYYSKKHNIECLRFKEDALKACVKLQT